jgi:hypothetical protein
MYDDVLYGPSEGVFDDGLCLWDGQDSWACWDNKLTDNELDIICGVYRVATGGPLS